MGWQSSSAWRREVRAGGLRAWNGAVARPLGRLRRSAAVTIRPAVDLGRWRGRLGPRADSRRVRPCSPRSVDRTELLRSESVSAPAALALVAGSLALRPGASRPPALEGWL